MSQLSIVTSALAAAAKRVCVAAGDLCVGLIFGQAQGYRPEAHYMRGPGPKWREKHARETAAQ